VCIVCCCYRAGEQFVTPAHYDDAADMKRFDPYTDMSDYDHLMPAGYDVNDGYNEDLRCVQCITSY